MNDVIKDFELAKKSMLYAQDSYSNFKVGAVLTTKSGKQFTGCNIMNHGIQSICAERVAFVKAISEGEKEFERIAILGGKTVNDLQECLPCGYCRQFMSECTKPDFKIYTLNNDTIKEYTLQELLPYQFKI